MPRSSQDSHMVRLPKRSKNRNSIPNFPKEKEEPINSKEAKKIRLFKSEIVHPSTNSDQRKSGDATADQSIDRSQKINVSSQRKNSRRKREEGASDNNTKKNSIQRRSSVVG